MKARGRLVAVLATLTTLVVATPLAAAGRSDITAGARAHDSQVVGYFIEWGVYGRNYKVKDVKTSGSAERLTVINYAFGNVAPDSVGNVVCKLGDDWADYQRPWIAEDSVTGEEVTWPRPILGNFQQLRTLKQQYPQLKVLISLGGWTWSKYFSDAALTKQSRERFVSSCIDLFVKGDIPAPGWGGMGGPGAAATTNHQSNLYTSPADPSSPRYSDDAVVNEYLQRGAPSKEIVLGAPFYSRGWTGVAAGNDGLYQPAAGAAPGTWEAGVDDYEVVKDRLASGFVRHEDSAAGAAWLFDGTTFWTFDDPPVMAAKAEYVRQNRLGGIMFWELSGDTPDGELIAAIADGA
jgi:GH18 family chitinase